MRGASTATSFYESTYRKINKQWNRKGSLKEGYATKKLPFTPGIQAGGRLIDAVFGTTKQQREKNYERNKIKTFPY